MQKISANRFGRYAGAIVAMAAIVQGAWGQETTLDGATSTLSLSVLIVDNASIYTDVQLQVKKLGNVQVSPTALAVSKNHYSTTSNVLQLPRVAVTSGASSAASVYANVAAVLAEAVVLKFTAGSRSSLFNLNGWKLQLPVDINGGASGPADEISADRLNQGFSNDYFLFDGDSLVFKAPANGAITSPGASTRSELREIYSGSNGSWTSQTGGTLIGNATVISVAGNSNHVTIGQIFGPTKDGKPFVMLKYRKATNRGDLQYYPSVTDASPTTKIIARNVALNQPISYTLSFSGDPTTGYRIKASVNGNAMDVTVDNSWADVPMYFKLGAYHDVNNAGNPSEDSSVVKFSSFSDSH